MNEQPETPSADPASHEPSAARPATCTCSGGAREPDPTDDYMRMLRRLAEIGMARAEQLHRQSEDAAKVRRAEPAAPPDADAPDLSKPDRSKHDLALHRTGRMVRQCMLLSLKFYNERLERDKQATAAHAVVEQRRKARRKQQIERVVKQAIEREKQCEDADEEDDFDLYGLQRALSERLDEDDIERDLDRCSRGELIARICREFGIEPNWQLWRQQQWALEEARLKPLGSPYAEPPAPDPDATEPEAATPPEPEPEAPEPEKSEPPGPEPEAAGAPPLSPIDRMRTPEFQRGEDPHRARMLARVYNGL